MRARALFATIVMAATCKSCFAALRNRAASPVTDYADDEPTFTDVEIAVPESHRDLSSEFTIDLTHTVCPDLTRVGVADASTEAECEAYCASDPNCDLYQYCPLPKSCLSYEGRWNMKLAHRCFVSTASSSRGRCLPEWNYQWLGKAKAGSTRGVPTRTQEVTRKRGMSGFGSLSTQDTQLCRDAQELGLENSWYYTWDSRYSQFNECRRQDIWPTGPNANGPQMGAEFVPVRFDTIHDPSS